MDGENSAELGRDGPGAADAFEADPGFAAWRALAEKTLKGAPFASLTSRTADGLAIEPLYPAGRYPPTPLDWGDRDLDRPWDVRSLVAHPSPEGANAQAVDDLQGGGHSILLTLDPTGRAGLVADSAADIARALEGVHTDLAPVALDAGFQGVEAARWLSTAAKGAPNAPLAFHLDPISAFAQTGESGGPMGAWLAEAASAARDLHNIHPRASLFLASGRVVHEAGGTEAQELAFALACALAYAKACEAAGMPRAAALQRIVVGLAADARPLITLAKLRAARLLWGKLSASLGAPRRATIEARGSLRMLSTLDAWTNLIRLTAAGFGAAAGGADAIVLQPFTSPFASLPGELARRQARNTQLVLMEETGLGRVADPGEGAGVVEALTDGFARKAWECFQTLEAEGGAVDALKAGYFTERVEAARHRLAADIARRKITLVGVTDFADLVGAGVPAEPWPAPSRMATTPRLPGGDDACAPMAPWRIAEPFEALRGSATGQPPAFLATLGAPAKFAGRLGFARSLLAAGGMITEAGPAADYDPAAAPLAVLCGSDEDYAEGAGDAARALKARGAKAVWLAGRPGDQEAAWRAAGVEGFLFAGGDALADLKALLSVSGAK